jgi:hypothetical protein
LCDVPNDILKATEAPPDVIFPFLESILTVMAEVVGITAAAVQFLDVAARLTMTLSRVYGEFQHMPRKVKAIAEELTEFTRLIHFLNSDIQAPNTGAASTLNGALSPSSIALATGLLGRCIIEAQHMEDLLRPLVPKTSDTAIKRGWRTVVGPRKENEILDTWMRLQGHKINLSLWYHRETLILLRDKGCDQFYG